MEAIVSTYTPNKVLRSAPGESPTATVTVSNALERITCESVILGICTTHDASGQLRYVRMETNASTSLKALEQPRGTNLAYVAQLTGIVGRSQEKFGVWGDVQVHARRIQQGLITICLPKVGVQILLSEAKPSEIKHFCHNFAKIRRQFSPRKSTTSTFATLQPLSPPPNPSKLKKRSRSPLPTANLSSKARSNTIHVCNISNPSIKTETAPPPLPPAHIRRPRASTISRLQFLTAPSGCIRGGWGSGGGSEFQGACGNVGKLIPTEAKGRVDKRGLGAEEEAGLSAEQRDAVAVVRGGGSLFLTGGAGTGKSFLLRKIIKIMPPESTFATASTGLAACHLAGTTIFQFAGIGLGEGPVEDLVERARGRMAAHRWQRCKTLIIDEVSMLDAALFDKLEYIARKVRKIERPFGGIQLILCGDFYQLPPVAQRGRFCFHAATWQACVPRAILLKAVFRQQDSEFVSILNAIREGCCSELQLRVLYDTCQHREARNLHGIIPTTLHTHKSDVDAVNARHLAELEGERHVYTASDDDVGAGNGLLALLKSCCPAREVVELKVGAQVMLLKSIDGGHDLCNGARGVVTRFTHQTRLPIVLFCSGREVVVGRERWGVTMGGRSLAARSQIPLGLAWALSIHKSQGMSLDSVEVSLERVFECGQAYVALSRARSLSGLRIIGRIPEQGLKAHHEVSEFYKKIENSDSANID